MRGLRLPIFILTLMVCLFTSAEKSHAYIRLLDGDLEINGFLKEQMFIRTEMPSSEKKYHKSDVDAWRSNMVVEGLYKLKQDGDLTVNLFGGFKYYYEKSPAIDSDKKAAIPRHAYGDYIKPSGDDLITELYADFQSGPLQVKIGKQIVVWGEMNLKQTADIINPLDLRYGSPGTEAWEDIKLGLWMIRALYQTDLPGMLNFEVIFNPGDFEAARLPIEGTYQGFNLYESRITGRCDYGIAEWAFEKMRRDEPGFNLSNWELGLKVRGYTWDVDWSFFYFNTLSDAATVSDGNIDAYNEFLAEYVENAFGWNGNDEFDPQMPSNKVFSYKRYEVLGATFQTRFQDFPVSEWRLEMFYYIGEPLNKAGDGRATYYAETRKDTFGFGLEGRDYYRIPYVTHNWFDDKKMTASFTFFFEEIFGFDRDLVIRKGRGHRRGDSHAAEIAWSFSQQFLHAKWFAMFTGSYNFIGKWFCLPVLSYAPDNHWRYEAGYAMYGSSDSWNAGLQDKDSLLLRLRYEF